MFFSSARAKHCANVNGVCACVPVTSTVSRRRIERDMLLLDFRSIIGNQQMYRGKGNVPFAYDERWKKVPGGLGLWNLMLVHLPALWRSTQSGIADRIAGPGAEHLDLDPAVGLALLLIAGFRVEHFRVPESFVGDPLRLNIVHQ